MKGRKKKKSVNPFTGIIQQEHERKEKRSISKELFSFLSDRNCKKLTEKLRLKTSRNLFANSFTDKTSVSKVTHLQYMCVFLFIFQFQFLCCRWEKDCHLALQTVKCKFSNNLNTKLCFRYKREHKSKGFSRRVQAKTLGMLTQVILPQ